MPDPRKRSAQTRYLLSLGPERQQSGECRKNSLRSVESLGPAPQLFRFVIGPNRRGHTGDNNVCSRQRETDSRDKAEVARS